MHALLYLAIYFVMPACLHRRAASCSSTSKLPLGHATRSLCSSSGCGLQGQIVHAILNEEMDEFWSLPSKERKLRMQTPIYFFYACKPAKHKTSKGYNRCAKINSSADRPEIVQPKMLVPPRMLHATHAAYIFCSTIVHRIAIVLCRDNKYG